MGKKNVIEKLHSATRKFEHPTSTGIRCFNRNGAKTGSRATRSSTIMKVMKNVIDKIRGTMTVGSDH